VIGAVVLAAGASTRYGRPKQWELLPAVLERLERCSLDEVVVVEGAHPLETTATVVRCTDWERGPGASLRAGLATLDPRAVARVLEHRSDADVVAASYGGERDHPVVLARAVWAAVPDEGARAFEPRLVDCADLEPPGDVDYS
jgi:CTP:molybdopterin cytidylyltransferase MocA